MWHESYTNDTSATQVKNFDNDTSKNIFLHLYSYYMARERLQGEEQFHSINYLLEMPCSHAKMRLKSAPQKQNIFLAKAISKRCTLDCSCKFPCTFRIVTHSNPASISIRNILCENTYILLSNNYGKPGKMNARFLNKI